MTLSAIVGTQLCAFVLGIACMLHDAAPSAYRGEQHLSGWVFAKAFSLFSVLLTAMVCLGAR